MGGECLDLAYGALREKYYVKAGYFLGMATIMFQTAAFLFLLLSSKCLLCKDCLPTFLFLFRGIDYTTEIARTSHSSEFFFLADLRKLNTFLATNKPMSGLQVTKANRG